jgi:hypothetical protein
MALAISAACATVIGSSPAVASTLPTGFRDSVVLSGLSNPTVLQFAPDGRIFVGQKNGVIKVFQSLTDTNPVTFADLSAKSTTTGTAGCSGWHSLPTSRQTRTSTCSTRTTQRSAAPLHVERWCPTPPGPTPTAVWCRDECRACKSAATS